MGDPQCGWVALKKKDERLFPPFVAGSEPPATVPEKYRKSITEGLKKQREEQQTKQPPAAPTAGQKEEIDL